MRSIRWTRLPAAALLVSAAGCVLPARFGTVAADARAQEAAPVLKQAFTLQQTYHAMHDRYAGTLAELEDVGWEDPPGLRRYHPPRIVLAGGEALCMEMLPLRDDAWPQHMDQTGEIRRGACP